MHRILQSLAGRDMVVLDPVSREYRRASSVAALGARALRESTCARRPCRCCAGLRDETRRDGHLSMPCRTAASTSTRSWACTRSRWTVELGRRFPLHAGSSGKRMLAHLDAEHRDEVLAAGLESLTPHTPVDPVALRSELDGIAARGWPFSAASARPTPLLGGRAVFAVSAATSSGPSRCAARATG